MKVWWLLGLIFACKPAPNPARDAWTFYSAQPRYLQPLPLTRPPPGFTDISAATCGACHQEIYQEWQISTHARAWLDDAQFMEELAKSEKNGVAWMCMNCHTPLMNQLPQWVVGLKNNQVDQPIFVNNPDYDLALQKEAITCATCHLRDGVVLGPYGDTVAPHPVKKAPELLSPAVCIQCHQAQARFEAQQLICVFNTGDEHAQSPQAAAGKICQDCHMPTVERPLWPGGQPRRTRRHWFGGSLIPKKPEYTAQMQALRVHYPPGLAVKVAPLPDRVKSGQSVALVVTVQNAEAGHYLPTGDPERFILVDLRVEDELGKLLSQRTEKIGIVYQWHPEVKKISDNRLAPLEERTYQLSFTPTAGPLTLRVEASRWRLSEENFQYHHLQGRSVPGQVFFEASHTVEVGR